MHLCSSSVIPVCYYDESVKITTIQVSFCKFLRLFQKCNLETQEGLHKTILNTTIQSDYMTFLNDSIVQNALQIIIHRKLFLLSRRLQGTAKIPQVRGKHSITLLMEQGNSVLLGNNKCVLLAHFSLLIWIVACYLSPSHLIWSLTKTMDAFKDSWVYSQIGNLKISNKAVTKYIIR